CEAYERMKALGRRDNQQLLLGPWIHAQIGGSCGEADFGKAAEMGELDRQRHFFDRHLKGAAVRLSTPRVRAVVMGGGSGRKTADGHIQVGGRWWTGDDWPPAQARITPYHFHADRTLSEAQPKGSQPATRYRCDPDDPVPSIAC